MISKKMQDAINKQLNAEMYSAYLYLSMASQFEKMNLSGCATWMKMQAQEEMTHAMKFYGYVIERGGDVELAAIDCPPAEWKSALAIFKDAYKHEQKVTGMINKLVSQARDENDYASEQFLQWFVAEQVEEEASVDDVIKKFEMVGDMKGAMFMLDRGLGQRGAGGGH